MTGLVLAPSVDGGGLSTGGQVHDRREQDRGRRWAPDQPDAVSPRAGRRRVRVVVDPAVPHEERSARSTSCGVERAEVGPRGSMTPSNRFGCMIGSGIREDANACQPTRPRPGGSSRPAAPRLGRRTRATVPSGSATQTCCSIVRAPQNWNEEVGRVRSAHDDEGDDHHRAARTGAGTLAPPEPSRRSWVVCIGNRETRTTKRASANTSQPIPCWNGTTYAMRRPRRPRRRPGRGRRPSSTA